LRLDTKPKTVSMTGSGNLPPRAGIESWTFPMVGRPGLGKGGMASGDPPDETEVAAELVLAPNGAATAGVGLGGRSKVR
jgi:hypothetical protein